MPPPQKRRRSPSPSPGPSLRPRRDYVAPSSRASPNVPSYPSSSATENTAQPNLAQMTAAPRSVGQHFHLPCVPDRPGSPSLQQPPPDNKGIFYGARDCTVTGTFIDGSVSYHNSFSNQFMEKLLEKTIRGAEHDSSDRDPPPRCQPGTRLTILERCLNFISNCDGVQKMRWVVGAAGVGKSAIMQSVAESPDLTTGPPASVFFSINGRNDGTKAIITLSYQLAAKSDSYRRIIEEEITRDPSLLRSSMAKQFTKLIVDPFISNSELNSANRVRIIIDGLDECKDHRTQLELLRLISDLCLTYPSSPLVWLIASRPEPHITSFFSRRNVIPAYEKEEVPIDSNEARTDVELFLREELGKIKEESDSLDPRWPEERDLWKIANAAGGLFAYAQTVVNYISDSRVGSPASQLSDVLHVIDKHPMAGLPREEHPMALLDALYERILSNVPDKIMNNTRKLLLALALSMTANEAYAAIHHLRSVLYVPRRDQAHKEKLNCFHKSFMDYLSDSTRSGFSPDLPDESHQLEAECTFRVLMEVVHGIQSVLPGHFTCGTANVSCDKISLTWPVKSPRSWEGNKIRRNLYELAIDGAVTGIKRGDHRFQNSFYIRFLITVLSSDSSTFPHNELLNVVFDETRRLQFTRCGLLQRIPLEVIPDYGINQPCDVELRIWRPATTVKDLSNLLNPFCWLHRWEAGQAGVWTTTITECVSCSKQFKDQLRIRKTDSPDDTALVLFTPTGDCCVQVRFFCPDDGMSEWAYSFWCRIPEDVRRKYGRTG